MGARRLGSLAIVGIAVFALGVYVLLNPKAKAAELTNVSPNPNDMYSLDQGVANPPEQPGGVSHMLKWETVAQVPETELGVYYDNDNTNRNITLTNGSGNGDSQCKISSVKNDNTGSNADSTTTNGDSDGSFQKADADVVVTITGAAGSSKEFRIPIKDVCSDLYKAYSLSGLTMDGSDYALTGKYKVTVKVAYSNFFRVNATGDWRFFGGSLTNSFNFKLEAGSNAIIGALKTDGKTNGQTNNAQVHGLRSSFFRGSPDKGVFFRQQFGFRCDESDITDRPVKLYDPDVNVFGDTYMKVTKNGTALTASEYDQAKSTFVNFNGGSLYNNINGSDRWVKATAFSGTSQLVIEKIVRGATYKLWVINPLTGDHVDGPPGTPPIPPNGNVFSISIPNDSIYGEIDCNYNLSPGIRILNGLTYPQVPSVNLEGSVTKTGNETIVEDHDWQIYKVKYNSEPSTRNISTISGAPPCSIAPGGGRVSGSCSVIYDSVTRNSVTHPMTHSESGPDPLGTRLCFFTRVKDPTQSDSDDNSWSYSDMTCTISGVSPRVQVKGYDLKVLQSINTNTQTVDGLLRGSWGEYGVFSNGPNQQMASGKGLMNGGVGTSLSQNPLTFANFGVLPQFGSYAGLVWADPNFNEDDSFANLTIGSAAPGDEDDQEVITTDNDGVTEVTGTLRINADIVYPDGSYDSIGEIPRKVYIADQIIIDDDVRRIDAWLIAKGAFGRITTCDDARSGSENFLPLGQFGLYDLHSGMCNKRLTFNGPVIANSIYLMRTTSPSADEDNPAEVFNLRPDAFLSSLVGGGDSETPVARTDLITELPPRF